jgi:hypothetical protein
MPDVSGSAIRHAASGVAGRRQFENQQAVGDGAFGARMAAYLGGDAGEAVSAQTLLNSKLVVTGLRCDGGLTDLSASTPAEKAFIVSVHLKDVPFHELRLRSAVVHTGHHPKGGVSVFDLEDDPRFFFASSFHCLHFTLGARLWTRLLRNTGRGESIACHGRTEGLMKP